MTKGPNLRALLAVGGGGLRQRVKIALGYVFATLLPGRVRQIREGKAREPFTRVDRAIIAAMVHRATRRGESLDHLAYLHRNMWQSDTIIGYHAAVEDRFTTWFLPHHAVVIDALERDLAALAPGCLHTLCEIGTGSGVTLDYLQRRLAVHGISTCIGLDLSAAQVQADAARFPACRFVAGDATAWIPANARPGWIIFCCGGVLEYFPRMALERLIADTATRCAPLRWVMVEPLDPAHDLSSDTTSRLYGSETTWSHPYPYLLRNAGLTVLYEHELRFGGMRWQLVIAGT